MTASTSKSDIPDHQQPSALDALGLTVPVQPDGAFYVWFDVTAHAPDSWQFLGSSLPSTRLFECLVQVSQASKLSSSC